MTDRIRFLWQLMVLTALLLLTGYFVISWGMLSLPLTQLVILVLVTSSISFSSGMIFLIGQQKEEKVRFFFTLVSIGAKFLLYLFLILIWWGITKNLTKEFIITFFVLYLVFAIFLISVFLKH